MLKLGSWNVEGTEDVSSSIINDEGEGGYPHPSLYLLVPPQMHLVAGDNGDSIQIFFTYQDVNLICFPDVNHTSIK